MRRNEQKRTTPTEYLYNYFCNYEREILVKEGSRLSANDRFLLKSVFNRLQNLVIVYGK